MKRITVLLLAMILTLTGFAFAEVSPIAFEDYLAQQAQIDAALIAECESGAYSYDAPLIIVNPYGNAPLSAVLIFTTDEEIGGTVTVKGKAAEDDIQGTFEAAKNHFVPVYGLYSGTITDVVLTLDNGSESTLQIETEPMNIGLTDYEAIMFNAQLYDYSKLTVCSNMILHMYAGYDSKGDIRWALTGTGANAITPLENGHYLVPTQYGHGAEFPNGLTGIREVDPMGKFYNVYVWNGGQHHEMIVMPDGNYMVAGSRPGYATNRDYVFEIDPATGEVTWELDMAEVITPGSSNCENDKGSDWCHDNALAYDEESDTLLISCRHLCAVVAVRVETKELLWILGDPAGWDEAYAKYLFTPVGDNFSWAYGQHQLTILSNGDLLMFDNGEFGRAKMVNADQAVPIEEAYSCAAIYHLDTDAMTAERVWQYGEQLEPHYYAGSMSGIVSLDEAAERYLITFGTCEENDTTATHIQYIEKDEPVWQLNYFGNSTYRSCSCDLYNNSNYDPYAMGEWHGDMTVTAEIEMPDVDLTAANEAPAGIFATRFPFNAVRFSGKLNVGADDGNEPYTAIFADSNGNMHAYDLGYNASGENENRIATLNRWVSLNDLPSGSYTIYAVMEGNTYCLGSTDIA